ncbi:MAG: class I SAM-dependent methyltransferase [Verrucomicrobia bacterium]|nr:class I SAM-dependent methyltransferase [Verrucomicrobiota bacterium]
MKSLIKRVVRRLGYDLVAHEHFNVVPKGYVDDNFVRLTSRYGALLKSTFIPSLPELDSTRCRLLARLEGVPLEQVLFIMNQLHASLALAGDVCEFGVASGATSAVLANLLLPTQKNLWLFDSFQGLPAPTAKDKLKNDIFGLGDMSKYQGQMSYPEASVRARLGEVGFPPDRCRIIPGFIEQVVKSQALPETVCFAFVDMDFYEPVKTVLDCLHKTIVPDGIVIVHDYDFFSTGAKTACDEFFDQHQAHYAREIPSEPFKGICVFRRLAG